MEVVVWWLHIQSGQSNSIAVNNNNNNNNNNVHLLVWIINWYLL